MGFRHHKNSREYKYNQDKTQNTIYIPIWAISLISSVDFGASVAPAIRTLYQYARYPGIKDLNKLYGLDLVPGKLNKACTIFGFAMLAVNIGLAAMTNFTNETLTESQQWLSFGVDVIYDVVLFGIGYGVGALVSLIPGVGVFIAPFAAALVTFGIDMTNEIWGWVDELKQMLYEV